MYIIKVINIINNVIRDEQIQAISRICEVVGKPLSLRFDDSMMAPVNQETFQVEGTTAVQESSSFIKDGTVYLRSITSAQLPEIEAESRAENNETNYLRPLMQELALNSFARLMFAVSDHMEADNGFVRQIRVNNKLNTKICLLN